MIILVGGGGGEVSNSASCASSGLSVSQVQRRGYGSLAQGENAGEGRERLHGGLHSTVWHLTRFSSCGKRENRESDH